MGSGPPRSRIRSHPSHQLEGHVVTTVHTRRGGPLDALLELTEEASREAPLGDVLGAMTSHIAHLLSVDVCSIYLRDEDELVLGATHGFPQEAVGQVRMHIGEGLTGTAVACLRPVSVARAQVDARNKQFAELHEERFPALCALPLIDGGRAVGALVVQRRQARAFGRSDIVLIAATASPVLFALERARARREGEHAAAEEEGRPIGVTLHGIACAPGRVLGTVAVRRWAVVAQDARASDERLERVRLGRALDAVAGEVAALDAWARERLANAAAALRGPALARLAAAHSVLDDQRLREQALEHVASGATAEAAMERVARQYARVLGANGDEALRARGVELEALCGRLHTALTGPVERPRAAAQGRVHVAGRITVLEAVELARGNGVAAVLAGAAEASPGIAILAALGLPAVADVRGLFRWASDGDRVLVDGDSGAVQLNPWRADIAAHRRERG
jgi:phosphotransferase system, enzyme I, PtsP